MACLLYTSSELAFYPVPKLFIKRVGGHEQWGAIHSAEIGDGTLECRDIPHTLQTVSYTHLGIEAQNKLYSLGSRISGKSKAFNKAVWEPMNYEGFRKLSYNASDQMNAELMTPVFRNVPKDIPLVATHVLSLIHI